MGVVWVFDIFILKKIVVRVIVDVMSYIWWGIYFVLEYYNLGCKRRNMVVRKEIVVMMKMLFFFVLVVVCKYLLILFFYMLGI